MSREPEQLSRAADLRTVAAVDLGSNSFHMIVVREHEGRQEVVDRLKESVRLAAGLTADRTLDEAACERALACLARFGQRLVGLPRGYVRVVGTNTLRQALNAQDFIQRAAAALGHPIEIIYGVEEARLIYGGVVQDLGAGQPRRLVVDIGGSSTELIIGDGVRPELMNSVDLGAVMQMRRFFPDGRIRRKAWQAALTDAELTLEPIARAYRSSGWDIAIGASGSVKSVLRAAGDLAVDDRITPAALDAIGKTLIKAGHVDKLSLAGVSADRRAIFPGGLVALTAIFNSLGVKSMAVSDKALREGVIADLLGRLEERDARETGVQGAITRFGIDRDHAERVAATALALLGVSGQPPDFSARMLRWAALLHEVGLTVAHRGYHKHGEYLARNVDLPGFSQTDQALLAALVRLHRGRFHKPIVNALPSDWQAPAERLAVTLRLAAILHRGRDPDSRPSVRLENRAARHLCLICEAGWLVERPLTRADLTREIEQLARADLELEIIED